MKEWRKRNRDRLNEQTRAYAYRRRLKVLAHYGNQCACCGETEEQFLSVDHIDGNGKQHRKTVPGQHLYAWLIRQDFPSGFQLLCHNCNFAKGRYGMCPHERARLEAVG